MSNTISFTHVCYNAGPQSAFWQLSSHGHQRRLVEGGWQQKVGEHSTHPAGGGGGK